MQGLLPLLVIAVVIAALLRHRSATGRPLIAAREEGRRQEVEGPVDVLAEAVEAGIITADQEAAIRALHVAPEAAPRRVPLITELLGYLGAVLVAIGGISLVAQFWEDLSTWVRLLTIGGTAAVLWGAGAAVDETLDPVLWRLRNVLWLLSSGAQAGFAGLLAVDVLEWEGEPVAILTGSAVAVLGLALWQLRDRPGPHLACLAGTAVAAGAAGGWADGPGAVGLVLLGLGAGWLWFGLQRRFPPVVMSLPLGAALALVGAGVTSGSWPDVGPLLGLATAGALLGIGTRQREFLVTAVGILGLLVYVPTTATYFFEDTLGVPITLLLSGVLLLGIALWVLSRRGSLTSGPRAGSGMRGPHPA